MNNTNKKRLYRWIAAIAVIMVLVGGCTLYLSDYYRADPEAIAAFSSAETIEINELKEGITVFAPQQAKAGMIFYPGGKVEYTAYAPLMQACAEQGILCVLLKMPFNLAVLDINAADGIAEQFPQIEHWYIGGHSLGGSMAATYLSKHTDCFDGLILLAAYSTVDLSATDLKVLSVYGSEDQVLSKDKYEKYRANLPAALSEVPLKGGCHAYFGMYGKQKGDGSPTISNEAQIRSTAEQVAKMIQ